MIRRRAATRSAVPALSHVPPASPASPAPVSARAVQAMRVLEAARSRDEGVNPRYLAYCVAHGEPSPDAMLERDRVRFAGGLMVGYIVWINARWSEWRRLVGLREYDALGDTAHASFDRWLADRIAANDLPVVE